MKLVLHPHACDPQTQLFCAAMPRCPQRNYLSSRRGQRIFVSTDGGQTWPRQRDPGGRVTQLIVARSSGRDWTTATLYAGTSAGVAHSTDGGDTWTMAALGEITSLAVFMPISGARKFYAGVYGRGLLYADAPGGPWQNLFGAATGLPANRRQGHVGGGGFFLPRSLNASTRWFHLCNDHAARINGFLSSLLATRWRLVVARPGPHRS